MADAEHPILLRSAASSLNTRLRLDGTIAGPDGLDLARQKRVYLAVRGIPFARNHTGVGNETAGGHACRQLRCPAAGLFLARAAPGYVHHSPRRDRDPPRYRLRTGDGGASSRHLGASSPIAGRNK
jgi:hypothetical protein